MNSLRIELTSNHQKKPYSNGCIIGSTTCKGSIQGHDIDSLGCIDHRSLCSVLKSGDDRRESIRFASSILQSSCEACVSASKSATDRNGGDRCVSPQYIRNYTGDQCITLRDSRGGMTKGSVITITDCQGPVNVCCTCSRAVKKSIMQ